jgi:hypothetical protein
MNLYLITWPKARGLDTYRSAVVAAPDADYARCTHPSGYDWARGRIFRDNNGHVIRAYFKTESSGSWASNPLDVQVTYIGRAASGVAEGVVVADFRAA